MEPSWINGLIGGMLIGLASALYLLFNGRIAGMTAILSQGLGWRGGETGRMSALFLLGAFGAAALFALIFGAPEMTITTSPAALILSGLIVGVGVTFGNGCTSGHGVCGMSRLSKRSIVATLCFMGGTAVSVFVLRHLVGIQL
ncbi:MAG: YeeE/YedE family protein [Rubrimonas sp.]|uniref:YeeE/YedE family protein n=1 Tax=Rubrimonas sp. TaxID=2036015 RepID=UPI002FDDA5F4